MGGRVLTEVPRNGSAIRGVNFYLPPSSPTTAKQTKSRGLLKNGICSSPPDVDNTLLATFPVFSAYTAQQFVGPQVRTDNVSAERKCRRGIHSASPAEMFEDRRNSALIWVAEPVVILVFLAGQRGRGLQGGSVPIAAACVPCIILCLFVEVHKEITASVGGNTDAKVGALGQNLRIGEFPLASRKQLGIRHSIIFIDDTTGLEVRCSTGPNFVILSGFRNTAAKILWKALLDYALPT